MVIPTYGRPRQLIHCLDALTRQTLPREEFEVVVVDDGGPEPLDDLLASFKLELSLRLVRQANAGPAAARNRGAREAAAPRVAFTDDDCRPRPEWLERMVAGERENPGVLVGGQTLNGLPNDVFALTSQLILDMVYDHFNSDPDSAYFFASNNILCCRERLLDLGGFDKSYPRAGAEDRDFCNRWRAAGLKLIWRPDAVVEHYHAQSFRKFLELHFRYGRGAYLYQARRRARGAGSLAEDLGFHRSLPWSVWRRLGSSPDGWRSLKICVLLVLWQIANAAGFMVEAGLSRSPFRS